MTMETVHRICPMCKGVYEMDVEATALSDYSQRRGLVQDIFPALDNFEREFLKSGYCPSCQSMLFGADYTGNIIRKAKGGEERS